MKSGEFTISQMMGVALAIAAVVILFMLAGKIYSLTWNKGDEGAKGYFGTLTNQIAIADKGGVGEFLLWQPRSNKDKKEFLLIYFGDKYKFSASNGRTFLAKGGENRICVCYWDGKEGVCDYCKGLDNQVKYKEGKSSKKWTTGPWAIATGEKVTIKKVGKEYEFVRT